MRLVEEAGSLPRLSLMPDPDTAARMLAAGRFDAVLACLTRLPSLPSAACSRRRSAST